MERMFIPHGVIPAESGSQVALLLEDEYPLQTAGMTTTQWVLAYLVGQDRGNDLQVLFFKPIPIG